MSTPPSKRLKMEEDSKPTQVAEAPKPKPPTNKTTQESEATPDNNKQQQKEDEPVDPGKPEAEEPNEDEKDPETEESVPKQEAPPVPDPIPDNDIVIKEEDDGTVSSREVYALMIRQLYDDGFGTLATQLSSKTGLKIDDGLPGGHLIKTVRNYKTTQRAKIDITFTPSKSLPDSTAAKTAEEPPKAYSDPRIKSLQHFGRYETRFVTVHKGPVRAACFSRDGKLAATASTDCSIKVLDVAKMHYSVIVRRNSRQGGSDFNKDYTITRPVIRTLYDHDDAINSVDFSPDGNFLASCGKDGRILFWDLDKSYKRSTHVIEENWNIRTIHYHPSSQYILGAGDAPMIRLYHTQSLQGYLSPNLMHQHEGPVTMARWAMEGNIFATSGKDGCVKIWDAVSMDCVNTIRNAHSGRAVHSVQFSMNTKYLLTNGEDDVARLWDMSTGREVMNYQGCTMGLRTPVTFSWDDQHVFGCCSRSNSVFVWDTRTGDKITVFKEHKDPVKWVAASPCEAAFITGGLDHRARFWAAVDDE